MNSHETKGLCNVNEDGDESKHKTTEKRDKVGTLTLKERILFFMEDDRLIKKKKKKANCVNGATVCPPK